MKKALICIFLILGAHYIAKCQAKKANVKFLLIDASSGTVITDDDIVLKILSEDHGAGEDHLFVSGTYSVYYPAGDQLQYTIISDRYYLNGTLLRSYNVIKGFNLDTILLYPIKERDLIIKGRVTNTNPKYVYGCKVEIDMENVTGYQQTLTDSLGFFQIIYENGKNLTGTRYRLTISSPFCDPLDQPGIVENKSINNLGEIPIKSKVKPPKVGYLKFKGPEGSLKSIVLVSNDFIVDEMKTGFFRVASKSDEPPDIALFSINCQYCQIDSLKIPASQLINKVYLTDLTAKVNYRGSSFSFTLGAVANVLFGSKVKKGAAGAANLGVSQMFNVKGQWFALRANVTILNSNFTESDTYITLPGSQGTALNSFSVQSLPEIQLCYYFKNPLSKKPTWYAGLNGTFYKQSFKSVSSDQDIDEEVQKTTSFSPGINTGIHYNLTRFLTVCGEASIDYLTLSNVSYRFNYFGRADEFKSNDKQLKLSLNMLLLLNL